MVTSVDSFNLLTVNADTSPQLYVEISGFPGYNFPVQLFKLIWLRTKQHWICILSSDVSNT